VQVLLALGRLTPQAATDQGVDAVGAHQDVVLLGVAVGEREGYAVLVLLEG
jgi:hypothetical protein